jgi:hypothetical protein
MHSVGPMLSGDVRQANRPAADHLHAVPALQFSRIEFERGRAMKRNKRWRAQWGSFLMGVCIGLLIVTPVLATPASGWPALVPSESGLPLSSANPMLDSAVLLIGLMIAQVVSAARAAGSRLVKR